MDDKDEVAASRAAASWRARLQAPDVTTAERAAFLRWLARPGNAPAWQRLLRLDWLAVAALRGHPRFAALRARTRH